MTIKLIMIDPQEHGALELRAVASFLLELANATGETPMSEAPRHAITTTVTHAVGDKSVTKSTTVSPVVDAPAQAPAGGDHAPTAPVAPVADAFSADRDAELDPAKVFTQPEASAAPTAPSAPQAPAPSAPVAPAAPGVSVPVDKAGLPWDARIHSESKAINKGDGLWRAKRGRDESIVPGIEAELRALMAVPSPNVQAPVAPTTPVPPAEAPAAPVAPVVPVAPTAPAPASAGQNTVPQTLGDLMIKAQAAVQAGRMEMTELTLAAQGAGVAALPLLGTRPDLIPVVYEKLKDKLQ